MDGYYVGIDPYYAKMNAVDAAAYTHMEGDHRWEARYSKSCPTARTKRRTGIDNGSSHEKTQKPLPISSSVTYLPAT